MAVPASRKKELPDTPAELPAGPIPAPESFFSRYKFELALFTLTAFTIVLNSLWFPSILADGYIWVPMTRDIGAIPTSDGRHRFLFALPAWAMYEISQFLFPVDVFAPAEFARIGLVWRIENAVFYALSVWFAFDGMRRFTESPRFAFFFATFVATSAHFFLNLSFGCVNLHGFFVNYLTLWLCAVYVTSPPEKQRKQLIPFSLLFGLMMLGKAHYNIVGALGIFVVLFQRRYFKDVVIFSVVQLVPVVLWAKVILPYVLHSEYANYEFSRPGYSLADFWQREFISLGFPDGMYALLSRVSDSVEALIRIGMGQPFLYVLIAGIALTIFRPVGWLMLIYVFLTDLYLVIANFSLPRHAEDFGPALYYSAALLVSIAYWTLPRRAFTVAFAALIVGLVTRNYSLDLATRLHGESFVADFKVPELRDALGL